tara:strand:+ start:886 stop:2115 length:1230 start_codon:yes stop_codon:yes gene_type:complete
MNLFRQEVLENRADRLHGNVQLALPVSWQIFGILFFVIVAAAVAFLLSATYSRSEVASGVLVPEGGIVRVVPTRAGTISSIQIHAGRRVKRGDPMVFVRTDESSIDGQSIPDEILSSLDSEERVLISQEDKLTAAAGAERAQLAARISGLNAAIAGLRGQIEIQNDLVATAKTELETAREVAQRGFISRNDMLRREETHLIRQQQLGQLTQSLASKLAEVDETRAAIRRVSASAGAQIDALASQRSDLAQRRASAEVSGAYLVKAPISGTVTAITAREGQFVPQGLPIMSIVPDDAALRVELYVPSSAIGMLEVGQEISVAIDAFPPQRFGTLAGHLVELASAPTVHPDGQGHQEPVYIVTALLEDEGIYAYGRREQLLPGMTVTARIRTEKQSLLEWLFEPLFAVRRR